MEKKQFGLLGFYKKIQLGGLTARGSTLVVVCRRQILTTKVYPRTVRVKIFLMAVDLYNRYSNESEGAN